MPLANFSGSPTQEEDSYHPVPEGTLFTLHVWSQADILRHHHGVAHQVPQCGAARAHTYREEVHLFVLFQHQPIQKAARPSQRCSQLLSPFKSMSHLPCINLKSLPSLQLLFIKPFLGEDPTAHQSYHFIQPFISARVTTAQIYSSLFICEESITP